MDDKFNAAASGIAGIFASFLFLAITVAGLHAYVPGPRSITVTATAQRS